MADVTQPLLTEFKGLTPARGTWPMAANTLALQGCIACLDADGRLTPGADNAGLAAVGKFSSCFDNRTTAPEGGGAGAIDGEVEFGVFGWAISGTTPKPGQVVFVKDNHTVILDSNSGQRGIAGYVVQVVGSVCYVLMGPSVAGQIVIASSEASQLDTAQSDIDALQADALTAQAFIPVPITQFTDGGAPLAAFVDGTTNGLEFTDSKALCFRFNPVGSDTSTLVISIPMPPDLDDTANVEVHLMANRVGSADVTAAIVGSAFFQTASAAYDADSDCITADTSAFDGATKVVQEKTLTIAAADVPAAPCELTLSLTVSSALDADDLMLFSPWIEYTRKLLTA